MRKLLILIGIFIFNYGFCQENLKKNENSIRSVKLRMMYGIIFKQYLFNPSYCMTNKNEISFGIYYRNFESEYLINWKKYYGVARFYGCNLGLITNVTSKKKLSFRNEFNIKVSIVYNEVNYLEKKINFDPLLLGVIYYGPNLRIKASSRTNICFLYQIGLGYGTYSSSKIVGLIPTGSGFYVDVMPSLDFQLIIN